MRRMYGIGAAAAVAGGLVAGCGAQELDPDGSSRGLRLEVITESNHAGSLRVGEAVIALCVGESGPLGPMVEVVGDGVYRSVPMLAKGGSNDSNPEQVFNLTSTAIAEQLPAC